jgi:hypothetical protein
MSTMTEDRDEGIPVAIPEKRNADLVTMPHCSRCNLSYMPTKSTSALRLTYCSFLCELGDLGFSMAGLEHMERVKKEPEPAAAE